MSDVVNLKRLLHRLQASLSETAHSSATEQDALRRWTYVEYAKELLANEYFSSLTTEEDLRNRGMYEQKLKFISDFMLASEGLRPSLNSSLPPSIAPPAIVQTEQEDLAQFKTQALNREEEYTRTELHLQDRVVFTEAELRKQLGLGRATTAHNKVPTNVDMTAQLERDDKERDSVANDILNLLGNIRDNSLNVQHSLQRDHTHLDGLSIALEQNTGNLAKEISRMGQLYLSTSGSCRQNCVMVLAALCIVFCSFLVLKLTPRP